MVWNHLTLIFEWKQQQKQNSTFIYLSLENHKFLFTSWEVVQVQSLRDFNVCHWIFEIHISKIFFALKRPGIFGIHETNPKIISMVKKTPFKNGKIKMQWKALKSMHWISFFFSRRVPQLKGWNRSHKKIPRNRSFVCIFHFHRGCIINWIK